MHLFTKVMGQCPNKRRDDDNNYVSFYNPFQSNPCISIPYLLSVGVIPPPKKNQNKTNQVHLLVIIDYVHLSYMYTSFSPYGKYDSDQSSFHQKSLEQYKYISFII